MFSYRVGVDNRSGGLIMQPAQPAYFDWLWQLFYSTDIYGILGPALLIILGFMLIKKDKALGIIWWVVEAIFISQYLDLAATTPMYFWNAVLLLLGAILQCAPILMKK